jgi:hypothetical protein
MSAVRMACSYRPPDAEAVRDAFRMRVDGATVQAVRDHLAAHGIQRAYSKVDAMLANRIYLGEIHFGSLQNPQRMSR